MAKYNYFQEEQDCLKAVFQFSNFQRAFAFMTAVAAVAEKLQHHPNWSNVYGVVAIELTTHDKGNSITIKDYQLATAIEQLAVRYL